MKFQTIHRVSAVSIVNSGWVTQNCTADTFVNSFTYTKYSIKMKWVIYKDSLCSIITWYQNCYKLVTMVTVCIFSKIKCLEKTVIMNKEIILFESG